jgi:hypothetical protein
METDSLGKDSSMRDFWKKKEDVKEKQGRKEKKRKGSRGKDSSAVKAGVDREGQETHQISETLDSTCLIPLTSLVGETNQPEQINTSEYINPDEREATLGSPGNTSDIGSELRAFRALYSLSDDSEPTSPADNVEDVIMEEETSTNQNEENLQDTDTAQADLSADITDLPNERATIERVATEQITEGSRRSHITQFRRVHPFLRSKRLMTSSKLAEANHFH